MGQTGGGKDETLLLERKICHSKAYSIVVSDLAQADIDRVMFMCFTIHIMEPPGSERSVA